MQDKFVGDIWDFGKYGLLRALSAPSLPDGQRKLTLGVVWYLVVGEESATAKRPRHAYSYLQDANSFRVCDQNLFDALRKLVQSQHRTVENIEQSDVFPQDTVFYHDPLATQGEDMSAVARLVHRGQWVQGALKKMEGSDTVFVDPDNGLDAGKRPQREEAAKYALFEELSPYVCRGKNVVIYQHSTRPKPPEDQIKDQFNERRAEIVARLRAQDVLALLFRPIPWPCTAFFVIPNGRDRELLSRRIDRFLSGAWGKHFQLIG